MIETVLTILGVIFILLSLGSLIYQIFSASILALVGIIFLNLANNWFNWYWLIPMVVLTVIASVGGFLITFKASQKLPKNKTWLPVISGILGAIFIPIPFVGALAGVFAGTLSALTYFPKSPITKEKMLVAGEITFKSFLGLILEISCVILMLFGVFLLVIF